MKKINILISVLIIITILLSVPVTAFAEEESVTLDLTEAISETQESESEQLSEFSEEDSSYDETTTAAEESSQSPENSTEVPTEEPSTSTPVAVAPWFDDLFDNNWIINDIDNSLDGSSGSLAGSPAPVVENFFGNKISMSFSISSTGKATIIINLSAAPPVYMTIYIEKKSLGLFWNKVDIGTAGDVWTLTSQKSNYSVSRIANLSGNGTYRAVAVFSKSGYADFTKTIICKYTSGMIMGDADGNGMVNASDARLVLRVSAGLEKKTSRIEDMCDMNTDGNINASDARAILRKSASLS